jgi:hypothetical protein
MHDGVSHRPSKSGARPAFALRGYGALGHACSPTANKRARQDSNLRPPA